jgi:TnpA family transposase
LKNLIADKADITLIERNWDDLLRLAGSIRDGKVSSSLVVSKSMENDGRDGAGNPGYRSRKSSKKPKN